MTGANLARAMRLSAPTVHEMLGRLERDGYIGRTDGRKIAFTESGREQAERIVGRHRMIERFLTDVVGVPWDDVHEEAEKLEYAMTPRFEAYVRTAVGDAATCPHGHPIQVGERIDGVPLADCEVGATVTILRLENEAEDLLHYLKGAGIEPGMRGRGRRQRRRARSRSRRAGSDAQRSPSASPRPCRCSPTPRRRRARRCPSSSCSARALRALSRARHGAGRRGRARRQPPADLRVHRRVVEQVEVGGAAEVGVLVHRERAAARRSRRCDQALGRRTSRSPSSRPSRGVGVPGQGGADEVVVALSRNGTRCRCRSRRRRGRGPPSRRRPRSRRRGP